LNSIARAILPLLVTGSLEGSACAQAPVQVPGSLVTHSRCGGQPASGTSRDAYVALSGGAGMASFEAPVLLTFELRVGETLACDVLAEGDVFRVDFVHFNEGQSKEFGHRDGFGTQAMIRFPLRRGVKAELGAGPMATFNSVKVNGVKLDEKHLGILASAALVFDLNDRGLGLRAAFNHSQIFGAHSADAILIGLSQDFGGVPKSSLAGYAPGDSNRTTWVSVMAGNSITNNAGGHSFNYGVEIRRQFDDRWALSATFVSQGDDKSRTDRKVLGGQLWEVIPITENWTFLAGAGPLWGRNTRGNHDSEFDGLITFRIERSITEDRTTKAFVDFNRLFSANDRGPDADLFRLGLSHAF